MRPRLIQYPNRVCYLLLLLIMLFDGVVLALTDAAVSPQQVIAFAIPPVILLSYVLVVSRVRFTNPLIERVCNRASHFCQGLLFLLLGWISLRLFNHLSMKVTAGLGYVDTLLSQWDSLLLANWMTYFEAVQRHPWIIDLLDSSYFSLSSLSVITFIVISCFKDRRRSEFFLEAFFLAAVVCIVMGMFFPAQGTVMTYLGPDYDFSGFARAPGVWFIEPLTTLRSDQPVLLDIANLPGLVTFPSFHVAAAVVLAASFWRTLLFVPTLIYSLIVTAATPIFGAHYIVDLVAGAAIAILVITALARSARYAGLFARSSPRRAGLAANTEVLQ